MSPPYPCYRYQFPPQKSANQSTKFTITATSEHCSAWVYHVLYCDSRLYCVCLPIWAIPSHHLVELRKLLGCIRAAQRNVAPVSGSHPEFNWRTSRMLGVYTRRCFRLHVRCRAGASWRYRRLRERLRTAAVTLWEILYTYDISKVYKYIGPHQAHKIPKLPQG